MIGGVLYTVGVVFHLWERLPYQNAIWHGFVLSAASCHFAAVIFLVESLIARLKSLIIPGEAPYKMAP